VVVSVDEVMTSCPSFKPSISPQVVNLLRARFKIGATVVSILVGELKNPFLAQVCWLVKEVVKLRSWFDAYNGREGIIC
jgi:hypothetical protein